jgi:hypothetical protein
MVDKDMTILLIGAISRRVNDISDSELKSMDSQTRALLRSIRTNLKLAISYSLSSSQTDTIASFLQVIVMSEGDKWILESTQSVSLALRGGRGVELAEEVVMKWVSRELKEGEVASVGEYLANCVGDLVLMGLWSLVLDLGVEGETLETWLFARDDRMTK